MNSVPGEKTEEDQNDVSLFEKLSFRMFYKFLTNLRTQEMNTCNARTFNWPSRATLNCVSMLGTYKTP